MRCTAAMRSSGVRNHAFVGESGKKSLTAGMDDDVGGRKGARLGDAYQKRSEVSRVIIPVMIINLM